jgi:hypothetical protein
LRQRDCPLGLVEESREQGGEVADVTHGQVFAAYRKAFVCDSTSRSACQGLSRDSQIQWQSEHVAV